MPEADIKKPPDKTRRAVVVATAGIVVILGLAVFYVAVVAPVQETHVILNMPPPDISGRGHLPNDGLQTAEMAIKLFGGEQRAARRLIQYVRLPTWIAPRKVVAIHLLARCARLANGKLQKLGDLRSSIYVHEFPGEVTPVAPRVVAALIGLLDDDDTAVRVAAARALGWIGPEAAEAIPALDDLMGDPAADADVRRAATEALKIIGIEGPDPPANGT